jgi:hypothetical protein
MIDRPARLDECPICGSRAGHRDYLAFENNLWVRCRHCGGGHREPYVAETEDPALTARNYDAVYLEPAFFRRRKKFADNQARWLAQYHKPDMAVVEVGPGLGLAAMRFLELFPGTEYHVVEANPFFTDYLTRTLGSSVILHASTDHDAALSEALRQAGSGGRRILLYLDNVLEHIAYPRSFIKGVKERLPSGSQALFDVPNERGLKWRCRLYRALGGQPTASPAHINLFTTKALRIMFHGLGLPCQIRQRGIRQPEEVNCLKEGPLLTFALGALRVVPIDSLLGIANNLRIAAQFPGRPAGVVDHDRRGDY